MSVISEFDNQVLQAMATFKLSRQKAIQTVARKHPELHSEYVKQTDAAFKARAGRK